MTIRIRLLINRSWLKISVEENILQAVFIWIQAWKQNKPPCTFIEYAIFQLKGELILWIIFFVGYTYMIWKWIVEQNESQMKDNISSVGTG